MSADIKLYNPFNRQFKLYCYHCGEEILNLNNVSEGHEQCIEEQNDYNVDKKDWIMRIDWNFKENHLITDEEFKEYIKICEAGFEGNLYDFIEYKNSFNKK